MELPTFAYLKKIVKNTVDELKSIQNTTLLKTSSDFKPITFSSDLFDNVIS